jgi:hypothetical protein
MAIDHGRLSLLCRTVTQALPLTMAALDPLLAAHSRCRRRPPRRGCRSRDPRTTLPRHDGWLRRSHSLPLLLVTKGARRPTSTGAALLPRELALLLLATLCAFRPWVESRSRRRQAARESNIHGPASNYFPGNCTAVRGEGQVFVRVWRHAPFAHRSHNHPAFRRSKRKKVRELIEGVIIRASAVCAQYNFN